MKQLFRLFIFLHTILVFFAHAEGFIEGTLVKTPTGYQSIEQLYMGDTVIACDEHGTSVTDTVTLKITLLHKGYVRIKVGNELLCAAPDQKFYLACRNRWIKAHQLRPGHILLTSRSTIVRVAHVEYVPHETLLHTCTAIPHHNYCVGLNSLITHNFATVITIGATWLIGGGIEFAGISCGLAAFGAAIGISCFNDKHKKKQIKPYIVPQNNVGAGFIDPEDPENKKNKRNSLRVNNMKEFFETEFGAEIRDSVEKTKEIRQGQSVYRVTRNLDKYNLKKGDKIYLDNLHKDHLEVFFKNGQPRNVLNLDGSVNILKSQQIMNRQF